MAARILIVCAVILAGTVQMPDDLSIHSMIVDGEVVEVADTRQLTSQADGNVTRAWLSPNGKYVAYLAGPDRQERLCVVKTRGGRSTVLMRVDEEHDVRAGGESWRLDPYALTLWSSLAWSPDSRFIAFPGTHEATVEKEASGRTAFLTKTETCVLVMRPDGAVQASFPVPGEQFASVHGPLLWSPDGRKCAGVSGQYDTSAGRMVRSVFVLDLQERSVRTVQIAQEQGWGFSELRGWSDSGDSIIYVASGRDVQQLRQLHLDGRPEQMLSGRYIAERRSPDGAYRALIVPAGVTIESVRTREVAKQIDDLRAAFVGWASDSKTFSYGRYEQLRDESGSRGRPLVSLWLACFENHKQDRMCVAVDVDRPTWSSDFSTVAYVRDSHVYLTELSSRPASLREKANAGIALTEEEEKECMQSNARAIATAIRTYTADWEECFPPADEPVHKLYPYCRNRDVFRRPGRDDVIFQYYPQSTMDEIADPSSTIVGTLDAGYSWLIAIYADGHTAVIPKQ